MQISTSNDLVFVFASNLAGRHGKGAAAAAPWRNLRAGRRPAGKRLLHSDQGPPATRSSAAGDPGLRRRIPQLRTATAEHQLRANADRLDTGLNRSLRCSRTRAECNLPDAFDTALAAGSPKS